MDEGEDTGGELLLLERDVGLIERKVLVGCSGCLGPAKLVGSVVCIYCR